MLQSLLVQEKLKANHFKDKSISGLIWRRLVEGT